MHSYQGRPTGRARRRHTKDVATARAFHIWYVVWGYSRRWDQHRLTMYEKCILGSQGDKRRAQDVHRDTYMMLARKIGDNRRLCSCYMCSGYKKYEKTRRALREEARDIADLEELSPCLRSQGQSAVCRASNTVSDDEVGDQS